MTFIRATSQLMGRDLRGPGFFLADLRPWTSDLRPQTSDLGQTFYRNRSYTNSSPKIRGQGTDVGRGVSAGGRRVRSDRRQSPRQAQTTAGVPQGLRDESLVALGGTAGAVPFPTVLFPSFLSFACPCQPFAGEGARAAGHGCSAVIARAFLPVVASIRRGSLCRTKFPRDWIARKRKSTESSIRSGSQNTSPSSWTATGAGPSGGTCRAWPGTGRE